MGQHLFLFTGAGRLRNLFRGVLQKGMFVSEIRKAHRTESLQILRMRQFRTRGRNREFCCSSHVYKAHKTCGRPAHGPREGRAISTLSTASVAVRW